MIKAFEDIVVLGGSSTGRTLYGSYDLLNIPSRKERKWIMSHLQEWELGKVYKHVLGNIFFVLEDAPIDSYEKCFECEKEITEEDYVMLDEKKKVQFKTDRPLQVYGRTLCRECEWKLRARPEVNA